MKPTVKVSIGGLAFNVEDDAFHVLNDYLQSLKKYFAANPEGEEIISDIELRMSELLQMRKSNPDATISLDDARDIIRIMGNPKDFYDNEKQPPEVNEGSVADSCINDGTEKLGEKKLYRDPENGIIAGVFSGLGHYFKVDPTLLRLIFVIVVFFTNFFSFRVASIAVFGYIILWIVMPKATTFKQKLLMKGSDPSIANIEDRGANSGRKYKGSSASKILGVILKIIVVILIVKILVILIAIVAAFAWLYTDNNYLTFDNYLILLGLNTINFKAALIMICTLPLIGLLSLFIKIIKETPFTSQTMVAFLVGFAFWIGAVFFVGDKVNRYTGCFFSKEKETVESINLTTLSSDTLYVKLDKDYLDAEPLAHTSVALYKGEKMKNRQIFILPGVHVEKDSTVSDYRIELKKKYFNKEAAFKKKNEGNYLHIEQQDSSLIISPPWYSNANPWDTGVFEIFITMPYNRQVIVESPLQKFYYTNPINLDFYDFHSYDYDFDDD